MTTHAHGHKAADTKADHKTDAKSTKLAKDAPTDDAAARSPQQQKLAEGEHVEQQKMNIGEALAHTGPNATLDDIGTGSVTELAPAVHGTMTEKGADRVVQQGDEVIVHGRSIIDGLSSMHGRVLKINADRTIAVRVQRSTGQTYDVPGPVFNADPGDGRFWFSFPDSEELADTRKSA